MKLNSLISTGKKNKKKLGRGIGSGKGKTSGRGHKGQKSSSGVAIKSFEGGQMPLFRRLPKRGFKPLKGKNIAMLNFTKLQNFAEKNSELLKSKINLSTLIKSKLIKKRFKMLKLIGSGNLKTKFDIEVNFISNSAKEKIEKLGGKVLLIK